MSLQMFIKKKKESGTSIHPWKAKQTFYINIPRITQREVLIKERKNRTTLIQKKKEKGIQKIESLKAKPQQEDLLFARAEEEEPRW